MIAALIEKDIKLYFRNRFFALISVLGMVAYLVLYFFMPAGGNAPFSMGIYFESPELTQVDERMLGAMEDVNTFSNQEALMASVESGETMAGLVISAAQSQAIERGDPVTLALYMAPSTPREFRGALADILGMGINWSNPSGSPLAKLAFEETQEVLGPDRLDESIPLRDRLLPLLLLAILAMETLGLATLITQEARTGTARAVLITPLRLGHFFASKTIMGVGLAFIQVLILITATGKLFTAPLPIIAILLVGSLMVTGIAFLVAAIARDSMSAMGWGMLAIIGLILPAMVVIFPAINTGWADLIPSYYLVDSLHRVLNFGAGWAEISQNLLYALITGVATLAMGSFFLRRRFQ